jgi:hypothetical protein
MPYAHDCFVYDESRFIEKFDFWVKSAQAERSQNKE